MQWPFEASVERGQIALVAMSKEEELRAGDLVGDDPEFDTWNAEQDMLAVD